MSSFIVRVARKAVDYVSVPVRRVWFGCGHSSPVDPVIRTSVIFEGKVVTAIDRPLTLQEEAGLLHEISLRNSLPP